MKIGLGLKKPRAYQKKKLRLALFTMLLQTLRCPGQQKVKASTFCNVTTNIVVAGIQGRTVLVANSSGGPFL